MALTDVAKAQQRAPKGDAEERKQKRAKYRKILKDLAKVNKTLGPVMDALRAADVGYDARMAIYEAIQGLDKFQRAIETRLKEA